MEVSNVGIPHGRLPCRAAVVEPDSPAASTTGTATEVEAAVDYAVLFVAAAWEPTTHKDGDGVRDGGRGRCLCCRRRRKTWLGDWGAKLSTKRIVSRYADVPTLFRTKLIPDVADIEIFVKRSQRGKVVIATRWVETEVKKALATIVAEAEVEVGRDAYRLTETKPAREVGGGDYFVAVYEEQTVVALSERLERRSEEREINR